MKHSNHCSLNKSGSPFNFFRHCETLFRKIFPQRVPLHFFNMFFDTMDVEKSQRVPFAVFLAWCDFFPKRKSFPPFNFLMFCYRMDVEKRQRVHSQFFGIVRLFSKICFFLQKVPLQLRQNKNVDNFESAILLARQGLALAGPGASLRPFFWFFDFRVL